MPAKEKINQPDSSNISFFLQKEWLEIQLANKRISRIVPIDLGFATIYAGEIQNFKQKKWFLYGSLTPETLSNGLDRIFTQAKAEGVYLVESNFNLSRWRPEGALLEKKVELTMPFGTYVMDLQQSEDTLLANMHRKHKKNIRVASAANLAVREGLPSEQVIDLLDQSYGREGGRDHGITLPYLDSISKYAGDRLLAIGAWREDELLGVLMAVYDQKRGYPLHAARSNQDNCGASHLLQWEMMRILKAKGVHEYDLGGARPQTDDPRLQGIFRFKSQFGGVFEPCFYWEKVVSPLRKKAAETVENIQRIGKVFS
ncbi:MAG: peptidoglycan bridge formation glycyltransferase FemA/FemB family protein [Magnetococcales bacterium]|nr:peptidoglycan bridge formation glycyltransferase FemA/FemB family protein [Magnetococcales bacterium]